MAREKLGEILIKAGLLDEASLQRALNEQQRWGGQLGRYLVEMGMISEETLVRALSTQYKLPAVALDPPRLNIAVGRLVPREVCERNGLICFRADLQKKFLDVAMSDPSNVDGLEEVRVATRFNVRPHIAAPTVIDKAISFVFYGDMALGGELDLSPNSPMRDEPQTSELSRAAARGKGPVRSPAPQPPPRAAPPPPVAPPPAAPPVPRAAPIGLELQISETPHQRPQVGPLPMDAPEISSSRTTHTSLRPVETPADGFHITLDMPAVDKEINKSQTAIEERLAFLEAVHARDAAILQGLLEVLVNRGVLTREEVLRLIIAK
jgi:hypothetical protein